MRRPVLTCLIALLTAGPACLAQHGHDEPDRWHTRHEHPHNPDHPESHDPDRFHTSRPSPIRLPLPEEDDAFFFVVFGDRTGGPDAGVSVLKDAVRDVNLLEPDLVMTVGDMIQGYNQTDDWMEEMREFKGIMDGLICPWFPVAGNHDVYWRGPGKPAGEHEKGYEVHFGPLWYAFEHKGSWFIVLYTDEGNPDTGRKTFGNPEDQRMSPEQFVWLQETLAKAKDAEHVFVFLHHPRWRKGGYGDDWDKVHDKLVEAGNVSGVFAGHIHRMKYQQQDGIEYYTLATVGGHQNGTVPSVGWRHHYNIVTVRDGQVATAAYPVGAAMDPRELTDALTDSAGRLAANRMTFDQAVELDETGRGEALVQVTVENPTELEVGYTLAGVSGDSRWVFGPDHDHGVIAPGSSMTKTFRVGRAGGGLDGTFRVPEIELHQEVMTGAFTYPVPPIRAMVPMEVTLPTIPVPAEEMALRTGGGSWAEVASDQIDLPNGPFTLECWMRANSFGGRVGLVAKTESSAYGFFVNRGVPSYSVHLNGRYTEVEPERGGAIPTGAWHHLAGVFDGSEVRLYLDGKLVGSVPASGKRTPNSLPLMIGADVTGRGTPTSPFDGFVDGVRLSTGAVYSGERFTPQRRLTADDATVLLLNMDGSIGPWLQDDAGGATVMMMGGARVVNAGG